MIRHNVLIRFTVADNSGVDIVRCIANAKSGRQNRVCLGDFVVVSVYRGRYRKNFSYKKVCFGLILTLKRIVRRLSGYYIRFSANRILLFSHKEATIGNRLRGVITKECCDFATTKTITSARWVA